MFSVRQRIPGMLWLALAAASSCSTPSAGADNPAASDTRYLLTYFLGNGEDGLHLAWSADGFQWQELNGARSYLRPEVGKQKLMRDPCLLQGPDGVFQMVWTDSWNSQTIGHASSRDLVHWSSQQALPVMAHEPQALNCWAPELAYDEVQKQFLIFWATTIPGRFPAGEGAGDEKYNHRMYCTTTKDFKSFTPTRLFFDAGFNVIDATMLRADGKFHLIVKDETLKPVKKNLRIAVSARIEGPFTDVSAPFTDSWVEGPTALRIGDRYLVYFDCYTRHCYGVMQSADLKKWEDVSARLAFPRGARHGTVLPVSKSLIEALTTGKN